MESNHHLRRGEKASLPVLGRICQVFVNATRRRVKETIRASFTGPTTFTPLPQRESTRLKLSLYPLRTGLYHTSQKDGHSSLNCFRVYVTTVIAVDVPPSVYTYRTDDRLANL